MTPEKCDACGRFVNAGAPGVSWSQQWSYDMSGCPDLHDAKFRCSPCTDKWGVGWTNCAPAYGGNGRNPIERAKEGGE
jgi:hypothetical protein